MQEETTIRETLIGKIKQLVNLPSLEPDEKRIVQIILTKLYSWNPYLAEFRGVGDLPVLIHQITSTLDILMDTGEEVPEQVIQYYKDDGITQIDEAAPHEINLEAALGEIERLPGIEKYKANIIGFMNDNGDNIYFIRQEEDMWLIDLPFSEGDDYSHMMSDDTLSTEAVKEIVSMFFTERDVMNTLRSRLALTEYMKQILGLEQSLGHELSLSEITAHIDISSDDAQKYIGLLDDSTEYEEREVAMLKQKARYAFTKVLDPNLYQFIVNLGMDFYTAKKVGKYLLDIGWIKEFPRLPIK